MLGTPLGVEPRLLDALAPELEPQSVSLELCQLLRLHLERRDCFPLGEVLLNRVQDLECMGSAAQPASSRYTAASQSAYRVGASMLH